MPRHRENRMKQRLDRVLSLRSGVALATVGLALMSAALAGCATATIDEAVPSAELMPAPAEATAQPAAQAAAMPADAPRKTGTFPNLNIKPQVASEQISSEEKQAQVDALTSAQKQQAAAAAASTGTTDPVLLRKLAAEHAAAALKEIEAQK